MTGEVIVSIILGAIASIFSGLFGYLRAKNRIESEDKSKERESFLNERELLAEQQAEFQNNMLTQINNLRDSLLLEQKRNLKLQEQVNDYKRKYESLEQDWMDKYDHLESGWSEKYEKLNEFWREKYDELEKENKSLLQRVQELEKFNKTDENGAK